MYCSSFRFVAVACTCCLLTLSQTASAQLFGPPAVVPAPIPIVGPSYPLPINAFPVSAPPVTAPAIPIQSVPITSYRPVYPPVTSVTTSGMPVYGTSTVGASRVIVNRAPIQTSIVDRSALQSYVVNRPVTTTLHPRTSYRINDSSNTTPYQARSTQVVVDSSQIIQAQPEYLDRSDLHQDQKMFREALPIATEPSAKKELEKCRALSDATEKENELQRNSISELNRALSARDRLLKSLETEIEQMKQSPRYRARKNGNRQQLSEIAHAIGLLTDRIGELESALDSLRQ